MMITEPRARRIDRDIFHGEEEPQHTFPAVLRRWATGEPYRLASEECREDTLIPTAVEAQATGEALLLDALFSECGLHRPTLTDGPFGIIMVPPGPTGSWSVWRRDSSPAGQQQSCALSPWERLRFGLPKNTASR
ncbi:hypothetical protein AB0D04_05780 [Streptomyces sp. NPDC048483]|uniref:hypothetical protein n=1 Tax=Streptomyces sp. NPDC048483 TaxID=3154927 RepID=UPI003447496B